MSTQRDVQRHRAVQVGFVMRAYRESFQREDGRRGLSQEELLERMALVDQNYPQRYSHTTVSRWESGFTRPSGERIRVFGKALGLSETEIGGLFLLAGIAQDLESALLEGGLTGESSGTDTEDLLETAEGGAERRVGLMPDDPAPSLFVGLGRFLILRSLPLALWTIVLGYAMSFLDWDSTLFAVIYVGLVLAPVLAQGFVFPDKGVPLREFYWISVFLFLSTPLLQYAFIQMDHYNFYAVGSFSNMPVPCVAALLLNLLLSSAAGMMFEVFWRRHYRQVGPKRDAFQRAARVAFLPLFVVFGVVMVITNVGITIQIALEFSVLGSVFAAFLLIRDPALSPGERDQRILFPTVVAATVVGSVTGLFIILFVYASPDLPRVLPDHNLITSWVIDFDAMGFSREDAQQRINLGYLCHAICVFVYIVMVLGGRLLVEIYRLGGGDVASRSPFLVEEDYHGEKTTSSSHAPRAGRHRDSLPLAPIWAISRVFVSFRD